MKGLLALALIFVSSGWGGARQAKPTLDSLAWIAGAWAGAAGGVEMEEHWTSPRGNSMIGMHRDVAKGRTVAFEFLRIEQQPAGIAETDARSKGRKTDLADQEAKDHSSRQRQQVG